MEQIIIIPENRIGRLIGKRGIVKRDIEKKLSVKMRIIDSSVTIKGDSLNVLRAEDIVKAIGIGFPIEDVYTLFDEQNQFMRFDIEDAVPPAHLKRLMGRIIGEKGKTKIRLQELTGVKIHITEDDVAGIGEPLQLQALKEGLEKLIQGGTHASVYKHIEMRMATLENSVSRENL
ncbi:MAG: RNA-processing protein [Candidatus Altiarchaeota archaeon]|nr:RNA-processing protein [Candidatus Altiarchaeota archaeon]